MTIDEKIQLVDLQLFSQKIVINSTYASLKQCTKMYERLFSLKNEKRKLLKIRERKNKLKKINESNL